MFHWIHADGEDLVCLKQMRFGANPMAWKGSASSYTVY